MPNVLNLNALTTRKIPSQRLPARPAPPPCVRLFSSTIARSSRPSLRRQRTCGSIIFFFFCDVKPDLLRAFKSRRPTVSQRLLWSSHDAWSTVDDPCSQPESVPHFLVGQRTAQCQDRDLVSLCRRSASRCNRALGSRCPWIHARTVCLSKCRAIGDAGALCPAERYRRPPSTRVGSVLGSAAPSASRLIVIPGYLAPLPPCGPGSLRRVHPGGLTFNKTRNRLLYFTERETDLIVGSAIQPGIMLLLPQLLSDSTKY